jgi:hypothetical protein
MPDRQRLLELALKGLEADRSKIDLEIAEIRGQLNSPSRVVSTNNGGGPTGAAGRKRKSMSAEARRKISEAMKRRYAAMKVTAKRPEPGKQTSGVGLTAAGRRKLSEMMKARWAAKRKAARKS